LLADAVLDAFPHSHSSQRFLALNYSARIADLRLLALRVPLLARFAGKLHGTFRVRPHVGK
jgi:hypothetical protein